MDVRIVAVGRIQRSSLAEACEDYRRRLHRHFPTEILECRDLAALRRQLERTQGVRILLDERGRQLDSLGLAGELARLRDGGTRTVTFYVGDAQGFTDADRERTSWWLALSRLTLPHLMVRVVLLEQLYRAATIVAGHPYHHE